MPDPNTIQELPEPVFEPIPFSENPPKSYEEALARVEEARAIYLAFEPPATDLPDTPERSAKDAVAARGEAYWFDRDPIALDASIKALALKIDAPSEELYVWGVKRAILGGRVLSERTTGSLFLERSKTDLPEGMTREEAVDSLRDEEADKDIVDCFLGMVKVIIKDGKPELVSSSYGAHSKEAVNAIATQLKDWDQRYGFLIRDHPRAARILRTAAVLGPFVTRMNPNKPGGMVDAIMMLYLHNAGEEATKQSAEAKTPAKK